MLRSVRGARREPPPYRDWFLGYAGQVLAPTLKQGDIVVMDNLRIHKAAGVPERVNDFDTAGSGI